MGTFLWVALGGAAGSAARHALNLAWSKGGHAIPLATLTVNVLGCLAIGYLATRLGRLPTTDTWRPLLVTGLLGGFTTYSAFGLETVTLMQQGSLAHASLHVGLHLCLGLGAVVVGMKLA